MSSSSDSDRKIYELWSEIQDLIGTASKWPRKIRRFFWTENLKHFDRILMCAFCYVNGLTPELLIDWIELKHLLDDHGLKHVKQLFKYFEEGRYGRSLYGWNITNNRYEYLDGSVRQYTHASLR